MPISDGYKALEEYFYDGQTAGKRSKVKTQDWSFSDSDDGVTCDYQALSGDFDENAEVTE